MRYSISFWKDKKVFITGHSGFKGSWLMTLLLKYGATICGYSRNEKDKCTLFGLNKKKYQENIINISGDIRDLEKLQKSLSNFQPDIIFHLAAQPLVIDSYKIPLETWDINLMGTNNLLLACKELPNKCAIIVVTTDKVYLNNEKGLPFKENDALGGKDPYSASKACVEIACKSWFNSFIETQKINYHQITLTTVRAGNVIGGADWSENRLIPDCIRSSQINNPLLLRMPKATRPWQHVLECINGYLLLAEYKYCSSPLESKFESFNFGPPLTSQQCVEDVVKEIQKYLPNLRYNVCENNATPEANLLQLDIEKSSYILGWKNKWDFNRTIKETIEWYIQASQGINTYDIACAQIKSYIQ